MLSGLVWGVCFFYFYYLVVGSSHLLVLLILVEFMILFSFLQLVFFSVGALYGLFFLLVGVCVGAYSICCFVFFSRAKSSSYMLSLSELY